MSGRGPAAKLAQPDASFTRICRFSAPLPNEKELDVEDLGAITGTVGMLLVMTSRLRNCTPINAARRERFPPSQQAKNKKKSAA